MTHAEKAAKVERLRRELAAAERDLETTTETKYERFRHTYNGTKLYERYQPHERGTWHVTGEDENTSICGAHVQPDLGYFEGTLDQVVRHAVELPKFWAWGGGGDIVKVSANVVTKL